MNNPKGVKGEWRKPKLIEKAIQPLCPEVKKMKKPPKEKFEGTHIERTKAGLRRAVAAGKVLGKVAMERTPEQEEVLSDWMAEGEERCGFRDLGERLGVSTATAFKWGKRVLSEKQVAGEKVQQAPA